MTFPEKSDASVKWKSRLSREAERKIYFYCAMGMFLYWAVSLVL